MVRKSSISDFNGLSLNGGDITVNPTVGSEVKEWWSNQGKDLKTENLSIPGIHFNSAKDKTYTVKEAIENFANVNDRGEYYSIVATIKEFK